MDSKKAQENNNPDGGYGWFIVIISFLSHILTNITYVAFSILYISFSESFQQSKATIGWVGSIMAAMGHIIGMFVAGFINQYGCRPVGVVGSVLASVGCILSVFAVNAQYLYVTHGILTGCGLGIASFTAVMIVQEYFTEKRALAGGISLAGQPLGALLGAILTRVWIQHYGWRSTMLLHAGICLNILPIAALYHPGRKQSSEETSRFSFVNYTKNLFDFSLMRNANFVLFSITIISVYMGVIVYYQNLPSRAVSISLTFEQAAWLPPCISLSSFVSRIILSWIANLKCVKRDVMYTMMPLVAAIVASTSGLSWTFPYMACNAAMFGSMIGTLVTLQPAMEIDLFGTEKFGKTHSLIGLCLTFVVLISTPLSGFIYDVTRNYDIPFYLVGAVLFLGFISMCVILIRKRQFSTPELVTQQQIPLKSQNNDKNDKTLCEC